MNAFIRASFSLGRLEIVFLTDYYFVDLRRPTAANPANPRPNRAKEAGSGTSLGGGGGGVPASCDMYAVLSYKPSALSAMIKVSVLPVRLTAFLKVW